MVVLSSVRTGNCVALTVTLSWFEIVPPALAVAVLVTEPLFRSACVTAYVALQVIDSPGSRYASRLPTALTFGHASSVVLSSAIVTGPASRTLPLLLTR